MVVVISVMSSLVVVVVALICDNNVIGQNVVPIRKCCKENEVSMYLT